VLDLLRLESTSLMSEYQSLNLSIAFINLSLTAPSDKSSLSMLLINKAGNILVIVL
jgi:hypothetical protein